MRRGAASCRAVLRSCPVTAAAGIGTAEPSWVASAADAATRARVAPPSRRSPSLWPSRMSGRRPRRSSLCPRPLSAMRTDVRPTGRVDVRCPHDRCDPGVRTDTRPVSAAAAAALSAPRWIRNTSVRRDRLRLAHRVRRAVVVGERLGRRCPNRAWREGMVDARLGRRFACVQAAAPRSPPGRPWKQVQGQVPVGWRGSGEGAGAPKSPAGSSWAGCRRAGRLWGWTGRL